MGLSQIWSRWADALVIVKPDTVIRWHRVGFRLLWRWKSRALTPAEGHVSPNVKQLIRKMGKDAPEPRAVQPPSMGEIVEMPEVGGLHHRYERRAA